MEHTEAVSVFMTQLHGGNNLNFTNKYIILYITVWDTEKTWGRGYNLAEGVRLGKTFLRQRLEV